MDEKEFIFNLKKELYARTVPTAEIEQYKIIQRENSLPYELILQAVHFAKIIKGPNISKQYILTIIKDWLSKGLHNPNEVSRFLQNKYSKKPSRKPIVEPRYYTKEQFDSLFDNVNTVVL